MNNKGKEPSLLVESGGDPFTSEHELCDKHGMVSAERHPKFDGTYLDFLNHLRRLGQSVRDPHSKFESVAEPFQCTGHAYLAGEHIRCKSDAHRKKQPDAAAAAIAQSRRDAIALLRIERELRELVEGSGVDPSFYDDLAALKRVGDWLARVTPIATGTGFSARGSS